MNTGKPSNMIYYINSIKEKNHISLSMNVGKLFDKTQHPLMIFLKKHGNSLAVQWLGFTAKAWVRSLVGELRSCMWHGRKIKDKCKILKKKNKNILDFLDGPAVRNPPANAGDMSSIPGLGRFHMSWSN